MTRIDVAVLFEDLHGEGGRRQRQAEAGNDRCRASEKAGKDKASAVSASPVTTTCASAEAEDIAPHLPEARWLQLEPDDEQQEHDAEFGDGRISSPSVISRAAGPMATPAAR